LKRLVGHKKSHLQNHMWFRKLVFTIILAHYINYPFPRTILQGHFTLNSDRECIDMLHPQNQALTTLFYQLITLLFQTL